MSRVGKKVIAVPKEVTFEDKGDSFAVKGPKGILNCNKLIGVKVTKVDAGIKVERISNDKQAGMNHGTMRAHLANAVKGVTEGFTKSVTISGTGYSAKAEGKKLSIKIGYSHDVTMDVPDGIEVKTPKPTIVEVHGINKQQVGNYAAKIRFVRPVEPYNMKGIKYTDEVIKKKISKKQVAV